MGTPLVEMKNISKRFGSIQALEDVNLSVDPAEVVGLVGDNAAGKSTLMKVLSGVHFPTEGGIHFDGKLTHIGGPHDARDLGIEMVYQDFALAGNLSIKANIFLGREPTKRFLGIKVIDEQRMSDAAGSILKRLKIDFATVDALIDTLSGGQQQAVAIARALAFEPKLVIMDEPTANLSAAAISEVRRLIVELKEQGIAVIIISHRLEDIFEVGDRVYVLKRGRMVGDKLVKKTSIDEVVELIVKGHGERYG